MDYMVQAKCMYSGYTDVFKVIADSAGDAVKKWSDDQFNIAGIMTDLRYAKVTACKLEHFKAGNVKADNIPCNTQKMGGGVDAHKPVQWSELSSQDKQDAIDFIKWDKEFDLNKEYPEGVPF